MLSPCLDLKKLTQVALVSIKSHGKTMNISRGVRAASGTGHRRESYKNRSRLAFCPQEAGGGKVTPVTVTGKCAVSSSTTSVNHSFRNLSMDVSINILLVKTRRQTYPLMVKMLKLLPKDKVL